MKYTFIERTPDTHQQPLSSEQIRVVCERAFGRGKEPEEVQELDGGEYNNTYLVTFAGNQQVILRVSPAPTGPFTGRGIGLMRNEHYFQPFLAPVATLMPKTLMLDFTQQLINRDYMFQTFMEGERWLDRAEELTQKENITLWQAYGQPERSKGMLFREQIYHATHFAQGRLDRQRQGRDDVVLRTYDKLRECITLLKDILEESGQLQEGSSPT
jgi:hypothetical protein